LKAYVEAFRAEGLKVGFYYSLIDRHHDQFPIDGIHPLRNHPDALEMNKTRDVRHYAEYMRNQVSELLTQFGEISVIWFDFSYPNREHRGMPGKGRNDWESEELIGLVRKLQPNIIVGDRLDLPTGGNFPKDLATPEQYTPRVAPTINGQPVRWEVCHTLSGSWGYHRDEGTWKDESQLINILVDTVALGGNLLMNVGPTARGTFDARANKALATYGEWMDVNSRSIYGAGPSEFKAPNGTKFTQKGNRLYLHLQNWPFRHVHIEGLGRKVKYAQFLHDASEIHWLDPDAEVDSNIGVAVGDGILTLELPVLKPDVVSPVVELILKD
jgi:alpha-L-fucosidase